MESFYLEEPSMSRKNEAIEYINEHYQYNSNINGSGSLDDYLEEKSYEEWLKFLKNLNSKEGASQYGWVPSKTYYLIREQDNKIIGMINIRLELNERLKQHGGHIGYGIRPTERKKGYNKINLYLGLLVCHEYGIEEVYLDADELNPASWRTMEALGGVLVEKYNDENRLLRKYSIKVEESLEKYKNIYSKYISKQNKLILKK